MRAPRPSALALLLLVAAGVAYGAEGTGGTLDATKQELRQLQSDQKSKSGQTDDKVRLGTPGIELQMPNSDSSAAWLADKLKKEKQQQRKQTDTNWLVEGVEKLEKEAESKGGTARAPKAGAAVEATESAVDQSDPQYLLKLFDEQKKTTDAKPGPAKSSASASPDAFAPFMQGWLGSSPVRGQFFDQFVKKPDSGGSTGGLPAGPADYRGSGNPTNAVVTPFGPHDSVVADKGNPYLTELNAPILTKEITGEASQLQAMGAPRIAPEAAKGGPVLLPVDPAPDARERKKTPLPGLTDDKKYFPQLKRF